MCYFELVVVDRGIWTKNCGFIAVVSDLMFEINREMMKQNK